MQEHVFDGRLKHHSVIKLLPCGLSYHESESSELQDLRCGFKIADSSFYGGYIKCVLATQHTWNEVINCIHRGARGALQSETMLALCDVMILIFFFLHQDGETAK